MSSSSVPPLHRDSNGDGVNENNEFPPGYRFAPDDDELIEHYLLKKITNRPLSMDKIKEVDLYKHNPKELADMHERFGENEWYFFTPRDRKYQNGNRPNRAADTGYWKATGADKKLFDKNNPKSVIGYKKALVFYQGKPPKGDKTNWIMHEYRVDHHGSSRVRLTSNDSMRLDDWVLCRIYEKKEKSKKTPSAPSNRTSNKKPEEFVNECDASEMMYNHNVMYDSMGLINTNTCSNRKLKAKKVPTLKPNKKHEFVNECDTSEMMMYNHNIMYDSMGLINTNTCSNRKSEAKKESTLEPNKKPVLAKKIGTFQMIHDHNCSNDLMRLINTNTRSNCALRPKEVPTLEPNTNSELVSIFGVSETTCNHNGMYGSMELNNTNDPYPDVAQSFQPFPSGLNNTNTYQELDRSLQPLAYNHPVWNHSTHINQSFDCMPNKEFRCYNEMKSSEPVFSRPYQPAMESNYMKNPQGNNHPGMGSSFMEIPQENNIFGDMGGSKQYNFDTQQAKFTSSQYDSDAMDPFNGFLNPKP